MPDLIQATQDYWKELDKLEAAYRKDEVSIEEVDARVEELMQDLGETRRETWRFFAVSFRRFWTEQKELVLGGAAIAVLTYTWIATLA